MKIFFTSDLHFQSPENNGIIKWAKRPFKIVSKHDAALIRGIRERVKPTDMLIHVGDFMNYGKNRNVEGGRKKALDYIKEIDRNIVFLEGNHDRNNGVRTIGRTLTLKVGKFIVSVSHYPSYDKRFEFVATPTYEFINTPTYIIKGHSQTECYIHLCGHVHDSWKYYFHKTTNYNILNINVGTDVWNYHPVNESELNDYIDKLIQDFKSK